MKKRLPKKKAFTLIEMIVVVAIIMVLASMITAGVLGARSAAKRMQCMANIRSIGQAALLYAEDSIGGRLPQGKDVKKFSTTYTGVHSSLSLIYDPVSFDDVGMFICPTQRKPTKNEQQLELEDIDDVKYLKGPASYFFVANGGDSNKLTGSPTNKDIAQQISNYPSKNIIVLEAYYKSGTQVDNEIIRYSHGLKGVSAYYMNGKTDFVYKGSDPVELTNKTKDLKDYTIDYNWLYQ